MSSNGLCFVDWNTWFFSSDVISWKDVCNTDRLRAALWIGKQLQGCFIHIEFYFKSNGDAHTDTKRWKEEMIQSGAHWAIVTATVENITPQSGLTADQIYLCLLLSLSPSACFRFENVFVTMHFIWQIWCFREISVVIFYLLIDLKCWIGQRTNPYKITQCSDKDGTAQNNKIKHGG